MESLTADPSFRKYAVCCSILAIKVLLSAIYTGVQRQRSQGYVNSEDARVFGEQGASVSNAESPRVAHGLRIQRNDAENIPTFYALGLVYVLSGPSPTWAFGLLWTYTVARVLHTIMYVNRIQPWRAICFVVGVSCQAAMALAILF